MEYLVQERVVFYHKKINFQYQTDHFLQPLPYNLAPQGNALGCKQNYHSYLLLLYSFFIFYFLFSKKKRNNSNVLPLLRSKIAKNF